MRYLIFINKNVRIDNFIFAEKGNAFILTK